MAFSLWTWVGNQLKPTTGQRQQLSIDNLSISVVACFRLVDIRTLCLLLLLVLFVCDIDD